MIGIVGGGAFGTALAIAYSRHSRTILWLRDETAASELSRIRVNRRYLPEAELPEALVVRAGAAALADCDIILLCVPTQKLRSVLENQAGNLAGKTLVVCCKGAELKTGMLPTEIVQSLLPGQSIAVLTGPSFASDIAQGLPTALCLAATGSQFQKELQTRLALPMIRIYRTGDMVGAQLGGALKNVVAIACGAAIGAGLGESARAALMTRGFAEMTVLAQARGASVETLMGLSGLGDLVLTCGSEQSRNFRFGVALGQGREFDPAQTVEGSATCVALAADPALKDAALPIVRVVADMVSGQLQVHDAIDRLLSRPLKEE
ncbi:MAG: NAD(P)H-dependent glycerol-3-phosphate dehydrogenase [Pseudomonadota bacterium]